MASKLPSGSTPSADSDRPRAQVAYEGEDEFSTMSLDPTRKKAMESKARLEPTEPGKRSSDVEVSELKPTNEQGVVGFLRKIFAR